MATAVARRDTKTKPLLTEVKAPCSARRVILEDNRWGGRTVLEGPAQRLDWKNLNNRIYRRSVFEKHLQPNSSFMRSVKNLEVRGEIEHPEGGVTNLARVSHVITDAWIEELGENNRYEVEPGSYVIVRAVLLRTPYTQVLEELASLGAAIPMSSRGHGNTYMGEDGAEIVDEDYELVTWDFVDRPSVTQAKVRKITEADLRLAEKELEEVKKLAGKTVAEQGAGGQASQAPAEFTVPQEAPPQEAPPQEAPAPTATPDEDALVRQAKELLRQLEELIATSDSAADCQEVMVRATDMINELLNAETEDGRKLRDQIASATRLLAHKIANLIAKKGGKKGSKKESIIEQDMAAVANDFEKRREKGKGPVNRAELEGALKARGHEANDTNVRSLASELRKKGYDVKEDTYSESEEVRERVRKTIEEALLRESQMNKPDAASQVANVLAQQLAELREKHEYAIRELRKVKHLRSGVVDEARFEAAVDIATEVVERNKDLVLENEQLRRKLANAVRLLEAARVRLGGKPEEEPAEGLEESAKNQENEKADASLEESQVKESEEIPSGSSTQERLNAVLSRLGGK